MKIKVQNYLLWWLAAALIMPILVIAFGDKVNTYLALLFWPSSISLMALGSEQKPFFEVLYIWSVAVSLNLILYGILGLVFYRIFTSNR